MDLILPVILFFFCEGWYAASLLLDHKTVNMLPQLEFRMKQVNFVTTIPEAKCIIFMWIIKITFLKQF